MLKIKIDLLEEVVKNTIGELTYSGLATLSSEIIISADKSFEAYEKEINQYKEELNKYKFEAIRNEDRHFYKSIFNFYKCLKGVINKLENSSLQKVYEATHIEDVTFSLGFFSSTLRINLLLDQRKTYINDQIDFLAATVQEVENKKLLNTCYLYKFF